MLSDTGFEGNRPELLNAIFENLPGIHRGETEVAGPILPGTSKLGETEVAALNSGSLCCWAIERQIADLIYRLTNDQTRTLETGAGVSTLVFSLRGSHHTAITPHLEEFTAILSYARRLGISLRNTTISVARSEHYLPTWRGSELDLVLIDGKHAFPWPIIDWFYTAPALKTGGTLILDDTNLPSVDLLCRFLQADKHWHLLFKTDRAAVFRKTDPDVHNVAWHQQVWPDDVTSSAPVTESCKCD
jgi:hypothetical protein